MGKEHNSKTTTYILLLMLFVVVAAGFAFNKFRYENRPGAETREGFSNTPYLYSFYVSSNPDITEIPYYGDEEASITITAFLDIESVASKYFIEEIFPRLENDYIDRGEVKFYQKNYITLEDIESKNNNFKYSLALKCINKIKEQSYYPIYFDLFSTGIGKIDILLKKHKIPVNLYNKCLENFEVDDLYKDALEIENLGVVGVNQRFYIRIAGRDNTVLDGVPRYTRFQKVIRLLEVKIGI